MAIAVVALFLLPLTVVLIELSIGGSIAVSLVCLVWMNYELNKLLMTRDYNQIHINRNGKWYITDHKGNNTNLGFCNSMRIGPALFLLVTLDGQRKRLLVLENQQDEASFHKLRVYLLTPDLN